MNNKNLLEKHDLRTLPVYENYPFKIKGIVQRIYVTKEQENLAVETTSGEHFVMKMLPRSHEVKHDSAKYTKIFQNAAFDLKDLSVPAANMLFLIMAKLEINTKFICLSEEDFLEHCGYSSKSKRIYYKAIMDLINLNIIQKRSGFSRCFWVNANIIYNGDRTKI